MRVLIDTNVLLRAIDQRHPFSAAARNALYLLHRQGRELCLTPQNVREFWNVCTRPAEARSGLGLSIPAADRRLQLLERIFRILPDSESTYQHWRALVTEYEVSGTRVHDAYLVASMLAHGIAELLTFDTGDFGRYGQIEVVDPRRLTGSPSQDF